MCAFYNIVHPQCFYSAKTKRKKKHKKDNFGLLPISAKFNIFSQTHLSSYFPTIDVVIMNQNLMHDKKIPQDQTIIILFMNNNSLCSMV